MSIGSLGVIGSVTAGQLQQTRGADSDRATQDVRDQSREINSAKKAADAAGIGRTDADEGASDRDADGRRMWELPPSQDENADSPSGDDSSTTRSADPTGLAGGNLDLTG